MCARYLGSKLPLNNRALRTFSCIDPTARGSEWTVRQVTENDTRVAVMGAPPPLEKKGFTICGAFLQLYLVTGAFFGPYWGSCLGLPTPPPSYENKFLRAPMVAVTSWICQRVILHCKLHVCAYFFIQQQCDNKHV